MTGTGRGQSRSRVVRLLEGMGIRPLGLGRQKPVEEDGAALGLDALMFGDVEGISGATVGILARWRRRRRERKPQAASGKRQAEDHE